MQMDKDLLIHNKNSNNNNNNNGRGKKKTKGNTKEAASKKLYD